MSYIAIQMYSKENKTCLCVRISEDGQFNIEQVIGWINVNQLGQFVIGNGLKPVNFSVDRNGTIKADCGDFSRFSEEGCGIVLAEIKSKAGRPLGYRLLSSSKGVVVNWTTPDIVAKAKSQKHPFLQNGIIRNDTVNCYPLHPYPVMEIGVQTKKRVTKSKVEMPKKKEEIIFTAEQKA